MLYDRLLSAPTHLPFRGLRRCPPTIVSLAAPLGSGKHDAVTDFTLCGRIPASLFFPLPISSEAESLSALRQPTFRTYAPAMLTPTTLAAGHREHGSVSRQWRGFARSPTSRLVVVVQLHDSSFDRR